MNLFFNILFISLFSFSAGPIYRINTGSSQNIDVFSNCQKITNASGTDIMVPTNTNPEWTAFLAHLPSGVTSNICAPYFVNSKQNQTSGSTNCTVTKPTGLQTGDFMIGYIFDTSNLSTVTPPLGFTQTLTPATKDGGSYYSATYTKLATAGDAAGTNFTFTKTTNFGDCGVILTAYRNVNQTTPLQTNSQSINTPASTTITMTTVTSTVDYSLLVAVEEGGVAAPGLPINFTSRFNNDPTYGSRIADKVLITASATGTITASQSSQTSIGRLFVLNPP